MPPPSASLNNPSVQSIALQVTSHEEQIKAAFHRITVVENQILSVSNRVRHDIRENYKEIKDHMKEQRDEQSNFMADIYGKLNSMMVNEASRMGVSAFSWKFIGAIGSIGAMLMAIGTLIGFVMRHI